MYMPPECFKRNKPSEATDIWSMGITILEALTGKPAWNSMVRVPGNTCRQPDGFRERKLLGSVKLLNTMELKELVISMLNYSATDRPSGSHVLQTLCKQLSA